MNKLIVGSLLGFLLSSPLSVSAQTEGRYVRKALPAPEFFVPPQAFPPQKEKLPPFNIPQRHVELPTATQESDNEVETITFSQEEADSAPAVSAEVTQEFNPNLDVSLPATSVDSQNNPQPKYQQEYDAYLKDLQVIAETGQAPQNPELEEDLQKMDSDTRLSVDENGNFSQEPDTAQSSEPYADNSSYSASQTILSANTQILETIEIVRYPKGYKPQPTVKEIIREAPQPQKVEESIPAKEAPLPEAPLPLPQSTERKDVLSPEAAAYFSGTNHFYGDSVPVDEEELEQPKKNTKKVRRVKKRNIREDDEPEQEEVQVRKEEKSPRASSVTNVVKPTKKTSRSAGSRPRSNSSSSGGANSFGLGPNMVR